MGSIWKFILHTFVGLAPPEGADPKAEHTWRVNVSRGVSLALIMAALALFILAVIFGFFPKVPIDGFARRADVSSVSSQFTAQIGAVNQTVTKELTVSNHRYAAQLSSALIDLREKQCKTKNQGTRLQYSHDLDQLEQEYFELTGTSKTLVDCGSL